MDDHLNNIMTDKVTDIHLTLWRHGIIVGNVNINIKINLKTFLLKILVNWKINCNPFIK